MNGNDQQRKKKSCRNVTERREIAFTKIRLVLDSD